MIRARLAAILALAVAAGALLGYLTQTAEATSTFYSLRNNPGATNYLNCSWHEACTTPPTPGTALDWAGGGGANVYFRAWSFRDDTSLLGEVASVSIAEDATGTCTHVIATVEDDQDEFVGTITFTHTEEGGSSSFTLWGDDDYNYQSVKVADVMGTEKQSCIDANYWTGAHLHQKKSDEFSYSSSNFLTVGTESIYGVNDWQYYDSWFN